MGRISLKIKTDTLLQSMTIAIVLTIVGRLFAFGRGALLARLLEPADLGTWALMLNAVHVLAFFLLLGIPSGLSRYVERYRQSGRLGGFLLRSGTCSLAIAVAAIMAGVVFREPIGRLLFGQSASGQIVALTLMATVATIVFSLLQGILHGLRLFRLNSWVELFESIGFFVLACVLLFLWQPTALAAGAAMLVATILATVAVAVYLWRAVRSSDASIDAAESPRGSLAWSTLVGYSLGIWSAGSLQAVWRCIDRYMLLHLSPAGTEDSLAQIGDYFIASKIAQPLSALAGLVGVVLLPHAARLWEERKEGEVRRMVQTTTKITALLLIFAGACSILIKPLAFQIVAGRMPEAGSAIFELVVITVIVVSLYYVVRSYLLCAERVWWVAGVWCTALGVNFTLNMFLIPHYQIYGAVLATSISAGLAMVLILLLSFYSGLQLDAGAWALCVMPAILLLPPWAMSAAVVVMLMFLVSTDFLLSADEKEIVNAKLGKRFQRRAKPSAAADLA